MPNFVHAASHSVNCLSFLLLNQHQEGRQEKKQPPDYSKILLQNMQENLPSPESKEQDIPTESNHRWLG